MTFDFATELIEEKGREASILLVWIIAQAAGFISVILDSQLARGSFLIVVEVIAFINSHSF